MGDETELAHLSGHRPDLQEAARSPCDLCGGEEFVLIARVDRHGQPLDTALCTHCGLVAHAHIPSDEALDAFYATRYRDEYHGEHTPSPRRVMRAWKNGERIYRQLAPVLAPSEEVFEIGAGIGCTVKVFERHGHFATGIEPNQGFQEFSRDQLHARVTPGYVFDLAPQPIHETILLVHVIEHFRSPRAALEHMHRLLKANGRLYVECPNLGAPFTTRAKLFHFAHIHNFTPTTLAMLARRCGFSLEQDFSQPHDPNLQMLFRRVESHGLEIDPTSVQQTLRALSRYNGLTYHLRWNYLTPRLAKLWSYAAEKLMARAFVARLIADCDDEEAPPMAQAA